MAPVIFDWFVLSMRMQVILDSRFARPGSAPIGGGKKGEFRDWTSNVPARIFPLRARTSIALELANPPFLKARIFLSQ